MSLPIPEVVRFDGAGLVTAIAQDERTGTVLMVAYMDQTALARTAETGQAHFWSRSRQRLWRKGETSGHVLTVSRIQADCDGDALLLSVRPQGPACHLGRRSCFPEAAAVLDELHDTLEARQRQAPPGSYTAALLQAGVPGICRKVGEEATEVILAAYEDDPDHLVAEVADLWFHTLVLLTSRGRGVQAVLEELTRRRRGAAGGDSGEFRTMEAPPGTPPHHRDPRSR